MKLDVVKNLIYESQNELMNVKGVKRIQEDAVFSSLQSKPIKIVTGFRRTGKSFLVKQLAQRVVNDKQYELRNVLYLNFENYKLLAVNDPEKLDRVYRMFKTEIAAEGRCLIIFDEIQNVTDWDKFIRTIYETDGENIEIILTGSNSELLSSELGSNLAGRFISFTVMPFSFKELLLYLEISVNDEHDFFRKQEEIKKIFNEYLQFGGLPETFSVTDEDAKYNYIQGIISKVILDDIVERYGVKNSYLIEKILYYLMVNAGNIVSFSRVATFLDQLKKGTTQETVIKYVQYIINTFALSEVQRFDWKQGRIFETTKKYYSVDTGLANSFDNKGKNYSKMLENIVYSELLRRKYSVDFGAVRSGKEIDFIATGKDGVRKKIQVTKNLHEDNKKRELSPFTALDKYLSEGENILLTLDDPEKINYERVLVSKENIIRWLLEI